MMIKPTRYLTKLDKLKHLNNREIAELKNVTDKFPFRVNDYYLSLIDWNDQNDPIRKIIIPDTGELVPWGRLDPSDEKCFLVIPGLEHMFNSTAVLFVSNACAGICRYCFRKRLFSQTSALCDMQAVTKYLEEHTEITNVLLTGGDPFTLATSRLEDIINRLRDINHIRIIRIGTKIPALNPNRIVSDPSLLKMLQMHSTESKKIYVMTHFVHPRELTHIAIKAVHMLINAGVVVANQAPLIRGVNDEPTVMGELLGELSYVGAVPYYIFQCRPALGNRDYTVPIEHGYKIVERAKALVSGLGKRVRFVMSHSCGKIEVVGLAEGEVCFRFHNPADDRDSGRSIVFKSNPDACWLDDYDEMIRDYPIDLPYRSHGPG